jgi:poly-beta-1,6-N-acetyl-D-glucosamine biosynthesis protein PgaD
MGHSSQSERFAAFFMSADPGFVFTSRNLFPLPALRCLTPVDALKLTRFGDLGHLGEDNNMHTLIIDRFACQPMYKRLLWTSLTAVGWLFWTSLWLPLLGSTNLLLGARPEDVVSTSHSLRELFAILGSHATVIVVASGLFLAWSLLQSYGNRKRWFTAESHTITLRHLAQSVKIKERDLTRWQQAQRMVVTHGEDSGWIRDVNVLAACA